MDIKYNGALKTLGPRAAQLFTELYERRHPTFSLTDVRDITGLQSASARSLVRKAEQRGLVTRLRPGLYNLVPFELGRGTEHVGSPYLIAREVVGDAPYFLSHATAFELHRMVTQPNYTIYVSCIRRIRPQTIGGYEFRFIYLKSSQLFGSTKHWVTKEQSVIISDLERTIIDGLRRPEFVGGITEVAKGLWMKREAINIKRLIDYSLRLDVGAVSRRLGYLLENYGLADDQVLQTLRRKLSATYQRLDPLLPAEGTFVSRWRLQLNVTPEELNAVRFG
jgi:predicted transcriptional regulator of viral defense system